MRRCISLALLWLFATSATGNALATPLVTDCELEQILHNWQAAVENSGAFEVQFQRIEYDNTFAIERRAIGTFAYESADSALFVLLKDPSGGNGRSNRENDRGEPYALTEDRPSTWVWSETHVRVIDGTDGNFNEYVRADLARGWLAVLASPQPRELLPLLGEDNVAALRERYAVQAQHARKDQLLLTLAPVLESDASSFSQLQILLDTRTWLPVATKRKNAVGNMEVVYVLQSLGN